MAVRRFEEEAEAMGGRLRLRWRDPLLVDLALTEDLEVLILQCATRRPSPVARRPRCVARCD